MTLFIYLDPKGRWRIIRQKCDKFWTMSYGILIPIMNWIALTMYIIRFIHIFYLVLSHFCLISCHVPFFMYFIPILLSKVICFFRKLIAMPSYLNYLTVSDIFQLNGQEKIKWPVKHKNAIRHWEYIYTVQLDS